MRRTFIVVTTLLVMAFVSTLVYATTQNGTLGGVAYSINALCWGVDAPLHIKSTHWYSVTNNAGGNRTVSGYYHMNVDGQPLFSTSQPWGPHDLAPTQSANGSGELGLNIGLLAPGDYLQKANTWCTVSGYGSAVVFDSKSFTR